jgi:hypothetical protein
MEEPEAWWASVNQLGCDMGMFLEKREKGGQERQL